MINFHIEYGGPLFLSHRIKSSNAAHTTQWTLFLTKSEQSASIRYIGTTATKVVKVFIQLGINLAHYFAAQPSKVARKISQGTWNWTGLRWGTKFNSTYELRLMCLSLGSTGYLPGEGYAGEYFADLMTLRSHPDSA
jgi:hypothetical protein